MEHTLENNNKLQCQNIWRLLSDLVQTSGIKKLSNFLSIYSEDNIMCWAKRSVSVLQYLEQHSRRVALNHNIIVHSTDEHLIITLLS